MTYKDYPAYFDGNTVCNTMVREEFDGYNIHYSIRVRRFLFFTKWLPVFSDLNKLMQNYTLKPIFMIAKNKTSERLVRVYPFGLNDMVVIMKNTANMDMVRENESLRNLCSFLYNAILDKSSKFESFASEDSVIEYMKKRFDTIDKDFKTNEVDKLKNAMSQMKRRPR